MLGAAGYGYKYCWTAVVFISPSLAGGLQGSMRFTKKSSGEGSTPCLLSEYHLRGCKVIGDARNFAMR